MTARAVVVLHALLRAVAPDTPTWRTDIEREANGAIPSWSAGVPRCGRAACPWAGVRGECGQTGREEDTCAYLLTEEQACLIAAKSDTPNATAILKGMIAVFVAWRHGALVPARDYSADIAALERRHQDSLAALETRVAGMLATIGTTIVDAMTGRLQEVLEHQSTASFARAGNSGGRVIKSKLLEYAKIMAGPSAPRKGTCSVASLRSSAETELRGHLGFFGAGRAWHDLPVQDYQDYQAAMFKLDEMLKRARGLRGPSRQAFLPRMGEEKPN